MKQRIRVAAICRQDNDILLLKRAMGRAELNPAYELPAGRINFGEQPEEAMSRIIFDYLGIHAHSIRITDAITFANLQNASKQGNLFITYEVLLGDDPIQLASERYSAYKWITSANAATLPLDEATAMVLQITDQKSAEQKSPTASENPTNANRSTAHSAIIHVDGGSRGNPGPSGVGYYITQPDGTLIKRGGEFIGFSTSRLAEYYALKEGIEQALALGLRHARFVSDSLMLVNQMNGLYAVKNRDLMPIYRDIQRLLQQFEAYSIIFTSREQNHEADAEVNKAINAA